MATWCEQPKEPDKSSDTQSEDAVSLKPEKDATEMTSKADQISKSEEKELFGLDEGQLKALLDEAITYKNPKDREGKSELFKELLQEAEADETKNKEPVTGKLPRSYYNLPLKKRYQRHSGGSREGGGVGGSTTRGGSLQNLHALGIDGSRGGNKGRRTLVSARQREGGSLPSNVNADNDTDLESIICPNYTTQATLEVLGPRNEEMRTPEPKTCSTHPASPQVTSSTTANLSENDDTGEFYPVASTSGISSTYWDAPDKGISISLLEVKDPFDSQSSRRSTSKDNASELDTLDLSGGKDQDVIVQTVVPPIQHVSTLSIPPQQIHTSDNKTGLCNFKEIDDGCPQAKGVQDQNKALDENGNALAAKTEPNSNLPDKKKRRDKKQKSEKNVVYYLAKDQIEGCRGNENIDELMKFIDPSASILDKSSKTRSSQANSTRSSLKVRAKEEDSRNLKRRTKDKFQRCNSMEEVSRTKLEDLTEESSNEKVNGSKSSLKKNQVTVDDTQLTEKSAWVTKDTSIKDNKAVTKKVKETIERISPDSSQDKEFYVVTKKHKKKKRRASNRTAPKQYYHTSDKGFPAHDRTLERDGSSGLLYQYSHRHTRGSHSSQQARRKSASSVPPSDMSESSDLDSVHSLPVSSTISTSKSGKNSTSGGSTPQASYADIARHTTSPVPMSDVNHGARHHSADPIPRPHPRLPSHSESSNTNLRIPATAPVCLKKDAMTCTNCDKDSFLREEYPPLSDYSSRHVRHHKDNKSHDKFVKTVQDIVIPVSEIRNSRLAELPTSKSPVSSLNSRRPAVILVDEPSTAHGSPGLTFGFEVNQQLLQPDSSLCNNKRNTGSNKIVMRGPNQVQRVMARNFHLMDQKHQKLLVFIEAAWNEAVAGIESGRTVVYDNNM